MSIISAYSPHLRSVRGAWQTEFGVLRSQMKECQTRGETLLVGADTNLDRLAAAIDRVMPRNDVSEASAELDCVDEVLTTVSPMQLAVARPAAGFQPTWLAYSATGEERVLDYTFLGAALKGNLRSVQVATEAAAKTSHCALRLELAVKAPDGEGKAVAGMEEGF